MNIKQFLAGERLTQNDLFGDWKQKGFSDMSDPASEALASKMLNWMRKRITKELRKKNLSLDLNATCKFKRGKGSTGKSVEIMAIYAGDKLARTITTGYGDFIVSDAGNGSDNTISEKKNSRKGKSRKSKKENRTPAEIQNSIPLELRTGWYNYDLMDKVNARVCEESVKYWNEHNGKFPKRKIRKSRKV